MKSVVDLSGARWRKSSYSGSQGGECVEVAPIGVDWRKSTYSGSEGGDCVEVAPVDGHVAVRDSKDPDGPALVFSAAAFAAFVGGVVTGELADA